MTGKEIRLGRLFSDGERIVIVAIDHGQTFGPMPGIENFPAAIGRFSGHLFGRRGGPIAITRLNWSTRHCYPWNYTDSDTVPAASARLAISLGADAVLATLILKTGKEKREARNVEIFAQAAAEAHELGLPLIGEAFPPPAIERDKSLLHDYVKTASRIICELGADAIKTFYTGDRFPEVVEGVPIPVLTLGADKLENELQALELAERSVRAGAKGVVFGRNVLQAKDPARFLKALKAVVKHGATTAQAAAENGLH
jgi:DhnA family fructose-bisphosphate aldolase class Ia